MYNNVLSISPTQERLSLLSGLISTCVTQLGAYAWKTNRNAQIFRINTRLSSTSLAQNQSMKQFAGLRLK